MHVIIDLSSLLIFCSFGVCRNMLTNEFGEEFHDHLISFTCCFSHYMLRISDGFHDMGAPQWQLFLCLLLCWVLVMLGLSTGVKSLGKVSERVCTRLGELACNIVELTKKQNQDSHKISRSCHMFFVRNTKLMLNSFFLVHPTI